MNKYKILGSRNLKFIYTYQNKNIRDYLNNLNNIDNRGLINNNKDNKDNLKFKQIDYKNIVDDEFIIKSKSLLQIKNATVIGSYVRYCKENAADLDLCEKLEIDKSEISDLLLNYFKNLKKNENNFFLTRLTFNIIDNSIQKLLLQLGYLDGLLQINNSNINTSYVDDTLPDSIKNKIKELIVDYNSKNDIFSYINLYMYLKDNLQPFFTLDEALKGEKIFNNKKIKLSDYDFTYMYIELIYDNFKISNFINFKKINKVNSNILYVELNEVLIDSINQTNSKYQMSYYKLLKYFFHFLKKSYFNKIFEESELYPKAVKLYNEIYDYRKELGTTNNNICKIENEIIINNNDLLLQNKYKELKKQFELKCKEYFIQVSIPFLKYLKNYLQFI